MSAIPVSFRTHSKGEDPWKVEGPSPSHELGCKISVEVPPNDPQDIKIHRSSREKCRYVQVEVSRRFKTHCFAEESIKGYIESFQHETSDGPAQYTYYDPKIAEACCLAPPKDHEYREGIPSKRGPKNFQEFEKEFFPDIFSKSRSGACHDLSKLTATEQWEIVRRILTTGPGGNHQASLDILNFTYQDRFLEPPQDQNDPKQVGEYFLKLAGELRGKSLAQQRLIILLALYWTWAAFPEAELQKESLLAKNFEELYRSTIPPGKSKSPLFDSDLDGTFDSEDERPLLSTESRREGTSAVQENEDYWTELAKYVAYLKKAPEGKTEALRGQSGIFLKYRRDKDQVVIILPLRIEPYLFRDQRRAKEFKTRWPLAKKKLELWFNAGVPKNLKIEIDLDKKASATLMVSSLPGANQQNLDLEDLNEGQFPKLLLHILNEFFDESFGGASYQETQAPAALDLFQPGRAVLDPSFTPLAEGNSFQMNVLSEKFHDGLLFQLRALSIKGRSESSINFRKRYFSQQEEKHGISWHGAATPGLVLGAYAALGLGGHFRGVEVEGRRENAAGLGLATDVGGMLLGTDSEQYNGGGVFFSYSYRPLFRGKEVTNAHGIKAAAAGLFGPFLVQAGPVWVREIKGGKDHTGLEFSLHYMFPDLHLGAGLMGGVRDLAHGRSQGGYFGVGIMGFLAGFHNRQQHWKGWWESL